MFFKKNGYHQNHLKVFGCLHSCFCVFMWIIEIFTKRSRSPGSSDMEKSEPPELLRPFSGAGKNSQIASNYIGKTAKPRNCCKKNLVFFLFSFYVRFVFVLAFFSSIVFFFVFVFDSCRFFFRFLIKFDKNKKMQKTSFFSFFFSIYVCFFHFSFFWDYFRTEKHFQFIF